LIINVICILIRFYPLDKGLNGHSKNCENQLRKRLKKISESLQLFQLEKEEQVIVTNMDFTNFNMLLFITSLNIKQSDEAIS